MLYHGTDTSPSKILITGLKPINVRRTICHVEKKYSLYGQLKYEFEERISEYVRAKLEHLFVYLTDDINEAVHYSEYGSNFVGLLEIEACSLLGKIWKPNKAGYVYFVDLIGDGEVKVPYVHPMLIVGWMRVDFGFSKKELRCYTYFNE